jgi:Mg2+/Co2+ transporter CorB
MGMIMTRGHSRVPIYSGSPSNIIGLILVSELNWFLLLNNIYHCPALSFSCFPIGILNVNEMNDLQICYSFVNQ